MTMNENKKAGGRPSRGFKNKILAFVSDAQLQSINDWRNRHEIVPTFSAAVRALIMRALEREERSGG